MSDTITRAAPAPPAGIRALNETVRSRVITASDPDYDDARAVDDAMHDRRARAAVQCTDPAGVRAVIAAARDSRDDLAIRGGGRTRWVRDHYAAIHPHAGSDGGYIDFMSGDDDDRAADNLGVNHERLSAAKAVPDPDNLFHVNQNIAPANGS